jgi:arsenate reductase
MMARNSQSRPGQRRTKVLFLCTNNSARSQMAEGLLRAYGQDRFESYSAGSVPSRVHPLAIKVMAEIDIDISGQRSKSILELDDIDFDYVVSLCDGAKGSCPVAHGKKVMHRTFPDPATGDDGGKEDLERFREVREMIKKWIIRTFIDD